MYFNTFFYALGSVTVFVSTGKEWACQFMKKTHNIKHETWKSLRFHQFITLDFENN